MAVEDGDDVEWKPTQDPTDRTYEKQVIIVVYS